MDSLKSALEKIIEKNKLLKSENENLQTNNERLLEELDKTRILESENEQLKEKSKKLQEELEDRDQTVKEAAGIISDLEYEVGQMEVALVETRPTTAQTDSDILPKHRVETQQPPPLLPLNSAPPITPERTPSIPTLRSRRTMTPARSSQNSRTHIRTSPALTRELSRSSAPRQSSPSPKDKGPSNDHEDIWRMSPPKPSPAAKPRRSLQEPAKGMESPSFAGPIFGNNFLPSSGRTPRTARTYAPPPRPRQHSPHPHTADAGGRYKSTATPPVGQTYDGPEDFQGVSTATEPPPRHRRASSIISFGRKVSLRVKGGFGRRASENAPEQGQV